MRPFFLLALLPFVTLAQAADKPRSAASEAACAPLAGAAYVPGIDAAGNKVASADLAQAPSAVGSDAISVAIDPKLAGKFGAAAPAAGAGGPYSSDSTLGYVTVTDGKASLNGKPLAPETADAAAGCSSATVK